MFVAMAIARRTFSSYRAGLRNVVSYCEMPISFQYWVLINPSCRSMPLAPANDSYPAELNFPMSMAPVSSAYTIWLSSRN